MLHRNLAVLHAIIFILMYFLKSNVSVVALKGQGSHCSSEDGTR